MFGGKSIGAVDDVLGNNESECQMKQTVIFESISSLPVLHTDLILNLFNVYLGLTLSLFS